MIPRAAIVIALLASHAALAAPPDYEIERREMVRQIEASIMETSRMTGIGRLDRRVLDAFAKVPRHLFVPPQLVEQAYNNSPLPLGEGQNLTQPAIAALMTEALSIKPGETVFETGTDTGYQAAILAELGAKVASMEIIEPLYRVAREAVPKAGYPGVALRLGDGYYGWASAGPFDAILVKESAPEPPPALVQQLKIGGHMVIPLGPAEGPQILTLLIKGTDGRLARRPLLPVFFTPFQGGTRT